MKILKKYCLILLSFSAFSQENKAVSIIDNYNNWGWNNVIVAKNKFISVAIVPDAAGRILEFNLGETPSLWVNPKLFGKSFAPTEAVKMEDWRNFGGYRLVPTPVDNFAENSAGEKTKRWPPPAVMGDSPYTYNVSTNQEGVQTIEVSSGIQQLPVPLFDYKSKSFSTPKQIDEQFKYKRSLHIEEGKSLVYIKHSLLNTGDKSIERGLKITSQHPSRSQPELEDGKNFLAYIPIDENHKLPNGEQFEITATAQSRWNFIDRNRFPLDKNNPKHIEKYYNHGTNWKGEVSPGIYELHYDFNLMGGLRIIAAKPWMCFVDKLNKTAFVKLFEPYNENLNYEYGVNAEIYNSGLETGYLETEIKTPIYNLKPNESFNYIEIQGAAKIESTPVLDVNKTGVITKKLSFHNSANEVSGTYGVFIEGKAILHVKNESGEITQVIDLGNVNPLEAFTIKKIIKIDLNYQTLALYIKDTTNKIHPLDTYNSP